VTAPEIGLQVPLAVTFTGPAGGAAAVNSLMMSSPCRPQMLQVILTRRSLMTMPHWLAYKNLTCSVSTPQLSSLHFPAPA
jgi:hypothetical protein